MKIGIIGGAGVMGRSYAPPLIEQGHDVFVFDTDEGAATKHYSGSPVKQCKSFNEMRRLVGDGIYVLTTPIHRAHIDITEHAGDFPRGSALLTFTSAKTMEAEAFDGVRDRYDGVTVMLGHPLHGGNPPKGQAFAEVVMQDAGGMSGEVDGVLRSLGLSVHRMESAQQHDKVMGDVQGNTHLIYSAAFLAWSRLGFIPYEHSSYQNTLDRMKADFAFRLGAANHDVYAGIAAYNPVVRVNAVAFAEARDGILRMRDRRDKPALKDMLEGVKQHVGRDEIRTAYETMTGLFGEYDPAQQTNSQLSMLATGEAMRSLGIHPGDNMLLGTAPYKVRWLMNLLALHGDTDRYVDNLVDSQDMRRDDDCFAGVADEFIRAIRNENMSMGFGRYKRLLGEALLNYMEMYDGLVPGDPIPVLARGKAQSDEAIRKLMEHESRVKAAGA